MSNIYNIIRINYAKLQFKCHFVPVYGTCRFMIKYNPPDPANFEKIYMDQFFSYHVKIISELQNYI